MRPLNSETDHAEDARIDEPPPNGQPTEAERRSHPHRASPSEVLAAAAARDGTSLQELIGESLDFGEGQSLRLATCAHPLVFTAYARVGHLPEDDRLQEHLAHCGLCRDEIELLATLRHRTDATADSEPLPPRKSECLSAERLAALIETGDSPTAHELMHTEQCAACGVPLSGDRSRDWSTEFQRAQRELTAEVFRRAELALRRD